MVPECDAQGFESDVSDEVVMKHEDLQTSVPRDTRAEKFQCAICYVGVLQSRVYEQSVIRFQTICELHEELLLRVIDIRFV
mmetsp:Transcript_26976/g.29415  ORF Transcript_26976/g.29415 Transcript_26976/m.29415 type:complete len:81 (-) Transcript_26976:429-671(-)